MTKTRINEIFAETNPEQQLRLSRALRSGYLKQMNESGLLAHRGFTDAQESTFSIGVLFEEACEAKISVQLVEIAASIKAKTRPH